MKIGDRVTSEYWNVEGVVQDVGPCTESGFPCREESLTLDEKGSGVITYYHTKKFVVVEVTTT